MKQIIVMHKCLGDYNEPVTIVIEPVPPRDHTEGDMDARDAMLKAEGDTLFDALVNALPGLTFDRLVERISDWTHGKGVT